MTEALFVIHQAPEMQPFFHSFFKCCLSSPTRKYLSVWENRFTEALASCFNSDIQNAAYIPKTHFDVSSCWIVLSQNCSDLAQVFSFFWFYVMGKYCLKRWRLSHRPIRANILWICIYSFIKVCFFQVPTQHLTSCVALSRMCSLCASFFPSV